MSDRGNVIINTLEAPGGNTAYKGVIVKLGKNDDAAICFDTELLRMTAAWTRGDGAGVATMGWAGLIDPRNATAFTAFHGGPPTVGVYSTIKPEKGKPAPARSSAESMMRLSTQSLPGWGVGEGAAALADSRMPTVQSPKLKMGPLPHAAGHWKGLYLNGEQAVLSYSVGATNILETPGLIGEGKDVVFTRTLSIGKSDKPMTLALFDAASDGKSSQSDIKDNVIQFASKGMTTAAAIIHGGTHFKLVVENGRALAIIPAHDDLLLLNVLLWNGKTESAGDFAKIVMQQKSPIDPASLTKGGPARWGPPIEKTGKLGKADGPYTVDTLTAPEDNPWKALVRFSGLDFFPDGKSAALCTIGGDVWLVSGIDDKLEHVKWKRFATGLFQTLGLRIVNGEIYVLGRDGITRLHDLNGDGEADFYENFNNDTQVTTNYHEFCLDLQTDTEGNFYFPKGSPWPPKVTSDHQGVMLKVSKDGSKMEAISTGLRAPNGTGMSPDNILVASDNQGHWEPACKVSWIRPGKFYGMVPAAHSTNQKDPTSFEQPIFWLPMNRDNSSGGEAFAPAGDKWGPGVGGKMVHMSYGMSSLFLCPLQKVDDVLQGAAIPLGLKFESSCMRARFNPTDGQLYLCGLKGWQTNAGREGAFHRVRYTGKPLNLPVDVQIHANGIAITSGVPLDKKLAADAGNWAVEQWNYKWTSNYGSPEFSAKDPNKKQHDEMDVKSATVSEDGKTIFLQIDGLGPVDQMKITCKLKDAAGEPIKWEIFNTIQKLAPAKK